jgi:hypothetical protein
VPHFLTAQKNDEELWHARLSIDAKAGRFRYPACVLTACSV